MKIFAIGMSGYIGSVVLEKLLAAGHEVRALTRSETSAGLVKSIGGAPVMGGFADLDVLRREADEADGVVQVSTGGFLTESNNKTETPAAIDAIFDVIEGSGKPYILTGGVALFAKLMLERRFVMDSSLREPATFPFYQHMVPAYERAFASKGLRSMIISPGGVFGRDGGYINQFARRIQSFRKHGAVYAPYPSDALISMVHVDDLADLYVLAIDKGEAGVNYFATSDNISIEEITRQASLLCGQGGAVQLVNPDRMVELDGWMGPLDFQGFFVAESVKARQDLGWAPKFPSLAGEVQRLISSGADINNIYPGPGRQAHFAALNLPPPSSV